jgi:cyclohexanone monooxygenase
MVDAKDRRVVDAVLVGAGMAGLYMMKRLLDMRLVVQGYEAGGDVGGTWYWNRYPGARVDLESFDYSYGFDEKLQQEWDWSERYASQAEILKYFNHVADRFNLRPHFRFNTRVVSAAYNEQQARWLVRTDGGEEVEARYLISAMGVLSTPKPPELEGLENFKGKWYHTGRWPHEGVDFTGLRVAQFGLVPPVSRLRRLSQSKPSNSRFSSGRRCIACRRTIFDSPTNCGTLSRIATKSAESSRSTHATAFRPNFRR